MDKSEIAQLVSSKTGLNADQAAQAVDVVIDAIKQKLPPEFAGALDSLLSGQEGEGQGGSGLLGALGGLFGKKDQ